ncbi:MAG: hypothetical protein ACPGXL_05470 [Chitinophagales bacterium]
MTYIEITIDKKTGKTNTPNKPFAAKLLLLLGVLMTTISINVFLFCDAQPQSTPTLDVVAYTTTTPSTDADLSGYRP